MKITIGNKTYPTKKSALEFYRDILNSYDFGESLNQNDFLNLIDLLNYHLKIKHNNDVGIKEIDSNEKTNEFILKYIRVAKYLYNTKCFELVYDNDTFIISYRQMINQNMPSKRSVFNSVCRNLIQSDLTDLKQTYFKNNAIESKALCQETNEMHKWENLVVDHRQPNTFSIIVDRFIELNDINVENIKYKQSELNYTIFEDDNLNVKFIKYHKEKATLRIVRKDLNLSRTGFARIKAMKKDLKIE